jgi:hypothetical protein
MGAAGLAAATLGAAQESAALSTAAAIASIQDSTQAGIMNERASALLDQAKAALMLARKGHDLITAGI